MKKGNLIPEILICTLISYRQWAIWLHGNDTLSTLGEASANLTAEHVSRVIKGSSRYSELPPINLYTVRNYVDTKTQNTSDIKSKHAY